MDEKDRIIAELKAENAALKKEIEELKEIIKELLNRNSGNSSQPPSLDKFAKKTKKPSGKPRLWRRGYSRKKIPSIDLTNNLLERNLRPAVIWRKVSFGTQSERGNRFVERILSVIETLKIQKQNVFEFLANCFRCRFTGSPIPNFGNV